MVRDYVCRWRAPRVTLMQHENICSAPLPALVPSGTQVPVHVPDASIRSCAQYWRALSTCSIIRVGTVEPRTCILLLARCPRKGLPLVR